jgi:tyrosine-protein kinase Etk/Wzc
MSESFRNIRTNLKINPSRKMLLVTSASPQEGKTTILVNLGLATAQEGLRTLLVSSDMRRPALAKTFATESKPGLTDVLSGYSSFKDTLRNINDILLGDMAIEDVLKPSGLRNIWFLPCGSIPHNPAELLSSARFTSLVEQLRQEFDVILFDSPPVLPVTDASLIAGFVDAVILCYETGRVSREALIRCKAQLDSVNSNIVGVILNHTKPQTEPIEPYPYYYRYKKYGYYTAGSEGKKV